MVFDTNFLKTWYWILPVVCIFPCTTSERDSNQLYPCIRESEDGLSIYFGQLHLRASVSCKVVYLKEKQIWVIGLDAIRGESINCLEWGEVWHTSQLTKQQQTWINQTKLYKHCQSSLGGSRMFCGSHLQTFACYCFCAIEERDQVATVPREGSCLSVFIYNQSINQSIKQTNKK